MAPDGLACSETPPRILGDAISWTIARLRGAGFDDPAAEAVRLIDRCVGISRASALAQPDQPLTPDQADTLLDALGRRLAGEPVTRIAGWTEFYGRRFLVTPDVLDPRPDTETLIDVCLENRQRWMACTGAPRILDVGTGSGCVLATLLAELPGATGVGLEISPEAANVAQSNFATLGVGNRAEVIVHDAARPLRDFATFNLIVSNPPYIGHRECRDLEPAVRDFDPELALFAGADGLDAYRTWARHWPVLLADGGGVAVEIGWQQAQDVTEILRNTFLSSRLAEWSTHLDLAGCPRCVAGWSLC